jgi:hypothetical protein
MRFRVLHRFNEETAFVVRTAAELGREDNATSGEKALREAMQKALQDAGLFEDEAEALLTAFQESYFHRPGLRLFFVAPQSWTQKIMPMNISSRAEHVWSGEEARRERPPIDAEVHRAMLGQIEIVTPEQRRVAAELAGREPKAPFAFVAGPHSIEGF